MINKQHKQRAVSNLDLECSEHKGGIGLRLMEGRLMVNVARIGLMYPYAKVLFGNEMWKSESAINGGMHPKWGFFHYFSETSQTLQVIVLDKAFLFGDTEIGRCTIHLTDVMQGHLTEWWSILSTKQEVTGAVLISFEVNTPEVNVIHSSNSSWDFRGLKHIESSPTVSRIKKLKSIQINNMTPDYKSLHFMTEPDEVNKLEQLRFDLIEENERLKTQENKVRLIFDKLKSESDVLKVEKVEVRRSTEDLKYKEEKILSQRALLENEKNFIEEGRAEIAKLKETLNLNYSRLKQEKLKARAHRKLLEKSTKKIEEVSKQLDQQKNRIQMLVCEKSRTEEVI